MLYQLRKSAFAIKNSTTLILPRWFAILEELKLSARMMPRDVTTRWNSTFDMLDFAIEYRLALDTITSERDMKLRQFELSEEDWETAIHLRDALKVWLHEVHWQILLLTLHFILRCSRTQHFFFHEVHQIFRWLYLSWITSTSILLHSQPMTTTHLH
jgi:hypothetical protein